MTDDTTETDAGEAGTTYLRTPSTPAPGCWVVTDLSKVDLGGATATGWELAWCVDGTTDGYRYYATLEDRDAVTRAVRTVEGTLAADRTDAETAIARAGYGRDRPVFSIGGTTYVRTIPDGAVACLQVSGEVTAAVHGPGPADRRRIATVMPTSAHEALRAFGRPHDVAVAVCLALLGCPGGAGDAP